MSGDHNQYQKDISYLDFECPRCGHCCYVDDDDISQDHVDETTKQEHEPVAWMYTSQWKGNERFITTYQSELTTYKADKVWPLYTAPPQRTWVGLTDEEKSDLWCESTGRDSVNEDTHVFADAIEAKLKEKNNG